MEIVVAIQIRGFQVALNYGDGDLVIGGDDYWLGNTRLYVRSMAALLPHKYKTSSEEYFFQTTPVNRGEARHVKRLG